jgi:hypothetical protein
MMKAKMSEYTLKEALELAEFFDNNTKSIKEKSLKEKDEINKDALDVLNKIQYEAIKRKIREEVI